MKNTKWTVCLLMTIILALTLIPAPAAQAAGEWGEPGNSDLNILNGGIMAESGAEFFYSENGIYACHEGTEVLLTPDEGRNLNVSGEYLYYTLDSGLVKRVPIRGGREETVYDHGSYIKQMYVLGGRLLRFISGGRLWEYSLEEETVKDLPDFGQGIAGLIPTRYGDITLTGEVFDYTVSAGGVPVITNVISCYTDSGYLVLNIGNSDYQAPLESLFGDFDINTGLMDFSLHGSVATVSLFGEDSREGQVCPVCEANARNYDPNEITSAMSSETVSAQSAGAMPPISNGQLNIVRRARQMSEIRWTPLADRYQWGYRGIFKAGTTYTGLPYGQPVYTGYVPWYISFSSFISSVNNNSSGFYTKYSEYNKIAPSYSCDCSSYVSWAWGTKDRMTTYSLPSVAERVGNQSIYSMQVGDCLNHSTSHVVLVSAVRYNGEGNVTNIDIMEQTPVITKYVRYGEGGTSTLARLQSYYLDGGYVIYRNPQRDNVPYTHDCSVPIDGDYCANCKTTAPKAVTGSFVGGKTVTLSHETPGAVIYYTTDGSMPTTASKQYTGPLSFYSTATLKAIAVTPQFSGSWPLEYTVSVPAAATPVASVTSGVSHGNLVSAGSTVALASASSGAAVYYTTDGSQPGAASSLYSGPLTVSQDVTIRAIALGQGMRTSEVASFTFKVGRTHTIAASAGAGGTISPSGNVMALEGVGRTFAITPGSGYAVRDVRVDGVSVGAVTSYTFSSVWGNRSISASFQEVNILPFTDVPQGDWYYPAVSSVYKSGLFNGTSAKQFSPHAPMTRGMFVTVAARLAGQSQSLKSGIGVVTGSDVRIRSQANTDCSILAVCDKYTAVQVLSKTANWYRVTHGNVTGYIRDDLITAYGGQFTDLKSGLYYSPYVEWAYLSGIVNGTSARTFGAESNITREQMCIILYNYAAKYGITLPVAQAKAVFSDDGKISGSAKTAVYALQMAGVIEGNGNGIFDPGGNATRAHVAQIFSKFQNIIR